MLHFELVDRVLDDGRGVDVGGRDDVGDVAVYEDVTGLQAQDRRLGAARVGAAEPYCGGWFRWLAKAPSRVSRSQSHVVANNNGTDGCKMQDTGM